MRKDSEDIKKIVYFVRHGQSEGNAQPVFQAEDSPLSELGKKQAEFIAERASHIEFEKLISSPQMRAKQTAEAISKTTNKKIEFSDLFIERVKPDSINGKSHNDPDAVAAWRKWEQALVDPSIKFEDGENYIAIVERAKKALDYLKNLPEKTILVATHGYFLRTMVAVVLLGETLTPEAYQHFQRSIFMANTGLSVMTYQNKFEEDYKWRLITHNDQAHLAD